MDGFFIDKLGEDIETDGKDAAQNAVDCASDEDDFLNVEEIDLFDESIENYKNKATKAKKKNEISLDDTYLITSYKNLKNEVKEYSKVDKLLEKSVMKPGLEKEFSIPVEKHKRLLKLERKKLRAKTKGKQWFDIPATEVTEELMNDFKLLKMRSALDKNHVYKKNDITKMPKYFQVGRVIESPADFYGGRIPKSQRKKTFVDELLADAEFQKYQKKKFKQIMDANRWKKFIKNTEEKKKKKTEKGNKKSKSKGKSKSKR